MPTPERLAEQFEQHRAHLRAVAYRMLGSASDAPCWPLVLSRPFRSPDVRRIRRPWTSARILTSTYEIFDTYPRQSEL